METEYGILAAARQGSAPVVDADTAAAELFSEVISLEHGTSVFLANGDRLYLDVGSHPEYATAECASVEDLLAHDRAGVELFAQMAAGASERLSQATGTETQIHLFKNNLDSAGHSCGCHENYLLYRSPHFRALVDSLVSFLVSRQIFTGAGAILTIKGEKHFVFSQRAYQIDDAVSAATSSTRPLVNTRDEPHADAKRFRRLHVIVGDSNVLEAPTRFKIATTNLLIAALEAGLDCTDLTLAHPVAALRDFTRDIEQGGNCEAAELADGRTLTAWELQNEFYTRLETVFSRAALPPLYREVLSDWGTWLEIMRQGKTDSLVGILDWPTKLALLNRLQSRHHISLDDMRISRLDLAYHDITSAGLHLDERGLATRFTTAATVREARNQPPSDTRARLRGRFIAAAKQHKLGYRADWQRLQLDADQRVTVVLDDPFASESSEVDRLIENMEAS